MPRNNRGIEQREVASSTILLRCIKDNIIKPCKAFHGHDLERLRVFELFKRGIEAGESNSALLIGPRGSGKTTLVNNVLTELQESHCFDDKAIVVRLNGFLHTDDRLALKDITRQLQLENAVGDKVFGSFAENLTFLLDSLRAGDKSSTKTSIFILDEFDLFCAHHSQTLLYNLFDVAQSAQAPVCVLGLTCRLDVSELLEKRVRSRFSHRQIFLLRDYRTDFTAHVSLVQTLLHVDTRSCPLQVDRTLISDWNARVDSLVQDVTVQKVMKMIFDADTSERTLKSFLLLLLTTVKPQSCSLRPEDFLLTYKELSADWMVFMLQGLSVLELCLVIAMVHLTDIHEGEPFNFEMVLRKYMTFVNKSSSMESAERPVLLKAFEHLKHLEVLTAMPGTGKARKEHQMHQLAVTVDQVREAVKGYDGLPTEVGQWAASSYC